MLLPGLAEVRKLTLNRARFSLHRPCFLSCQSNLICSSDKCLALEKYQLNNPSDIIEINVCL